MKNIANRFEFNKWNVAAVLILAVLPLLSACQGQGIYRTYRGEPLAADKVAVLVVPAKFNVLYIDDTKFQPPVLTNGAQLELLPGKHRLLVEYDEFWDLSNDEHERVTSQPVLVSFQLAPGGRYRLQARQLTDVNQARAFAGKPEVKLIDQVSGQSLSVVQNYKLMEQKYLSGFTADNPAMGGTDANLMPAKMLEYWWGRADAEQQQNFLDWAKSHTKDAR